MFSIVSEIYEIAHDLKIASGLSRIQEHLSDPTLAAGVISAFLTNPEKIQELYGNAAKNQRKIIVQTPAIISGEKPTDITLVHPEQMKRHRALRNDIVKNGFGYTELRGYWINELGRQIEEYSFLVTAPKERAKELKTFLKNMQQKYNQSAYLWIEPETRQVYADDFNIGTFKGGKLGDMYSKIKGRPFIFE